MTLSYGGIAYGGLARAFVLKRRITVKRVGGEGPDKLGFNSW